MKLSKSKNIVSLFHLKALLPENVYPEISDCVKPLVQKFVVIFQEPVSLPLGRNTDYQIHLKPGVDPINVRPCRYPQFQKSEMEKLVHEMLQQWIIRPSQSPLSSPVLLVKKRWIIEVLH